MREQSATSSPFYSAVRHEPLALPVFELAALRAGVHDRALLTACAEWGAFYVCAPTRDVARREAVLQASRRFFALPEATKLTLHNAGNYRGYIPLQEHTWESIEFGLDRAHGPVDAQYLFHNPSRWPSDVALPGWRRVVEDYIALMHERCRHILHALVRGLGHGHSHSLAHLSGTLRLLSYRGLEERGRAMELAPHTDSGFLTAILQDEVGGLQLRWRGDQWRDVPPIPDTWVCLVGDMLSLLSDRRLRAPIHRTVVQTKHPRSALAYFAEPSSGQRIKPLSASEDGALSVCYGDYLEQKIARQFAGQYDRVSRSG